MLVLQRRCCNTHPCCDKLLHFHFFRCKQCIMSLTNKLGKRSNEEAFDEYEEPRTERLGDDLLVSLSEDSGIGEDKSTGNLCAKDSSDEEAGDGGEAHRRSLAEVNRWLSKDISMNLTTTGWVHKRCITRDAEFDDDFFPLPTSEKQLDDEKPAPKPVFRYFGSTLSL